MAENKQYITQAQTNGNVMISEDVVATIIEHAIHVGEGELHEHKTWRRYC